MVLGKRYRDDGKAVLTLNEIQRSYIQIVKNKIDSGQYKAETVPCAVCEGTSFEVLAEKERYGFSCTFSICKKCGLAQTNPRMEQNAYADFYNQEYRFIYGGEEGPTASFFKDQYFRLGKKIFEFLESNVGSHSVRGKYVLEVGCGAGGILKYFKDQGCRVKGIDIGSSFIAYGREVHGLDLEVTTIENLVLRENPDIIIYSHVLEHILDLNGQLKSIKKLMHSDTLLYIEVPGLRNLHHSYNNDLLRYLQNAHVYHFTKRSLLNLLEKNGFKSILVTEFVKSIFKLNAAPQKAEAIDECNNIISYLKRIEWMRTYFPVAPYVLKYRIKRFIYRVFAFFKVVPQLKQNKKWNYEAID